MLQDIDINMCSFCHKTTAVLSQNICGSRFEKKSKSSYSKARRVDGGKCLLTISSHLNLYMHLDICLFQIRKGREKRERL